VTAINAARGKIVWKFVTPEPGRAGITTTATGLGFAPGGDGVLRAFDTLSGNVLWSFQTGFQLAAGASIYEAHGKEYIALTVGGTQTSSYGGTASRLQIFALKGDTRQSISPALRPPGAGPGVLRAPSQFLQAGAEPHTIELQIVASLNDGAGKNTLDGTSHGGMTVQVPEGWKVYVTFANHATSRTDGIAVLSAPGGGAPAFDRAATPGAVPASGIAYFQFTASRQGNYVIASTSKRQAAAGEWMHFNVVSESQSPELTLARGAGQRQTYVIVARAGPGG
jgi:hypothetical protein